jgi:plastocyanin
MRTSTRPRSASFALALCVSLTALRAGAEDLRGTVQLVARGGKGPAAESDVSQAVVYFEPAGGAPPRRAEVPFEMVTRQKQFLPRVLVVPRGARVRFPNQDPILHNVFSVSPGNFFDLGLYNQGPGKEQKLDQPGLVRVFCNVHHSMVAYILVLDTPYYTQPGPDGRFSLSGLPKGPGRLTVWHEQTEPWTASLTLPQAQAASPASQTAPPLITARVEVVRPRIPPHLNKTGQSYFRSGRDRYDQP